MDNPHVSKRQQHQVNQRPMILVLSGIFLLCHSLAIANGEAPTKYWDNKKPGDILLEVYFTPFEAEPYVPHGMKNIERSSWRKLVFVTTLLQTANPFVESFFAMLHSGTSTAALINRGDIRLKAKFSLGTKYAGEVFYMDIAGVLLHEPTGKQSKLPPESLEKIEHEIVQFEGVVDLLSATMAKEGIESLRPKKRKK